MLTPHASQATTIAIQLPIFAIAAVSGYVLSIARMDRFGHRRLQLTGFVMMSVCFAVVGLMPGMTTAVVPFLLAYGVSYFFTEFGPNVTTFALSESCSPPGMRQPGTASPPASGNSAAGSSSPSSRTPSACAAHFTSPSAYPSSVRSSPPVLPELAGRNLEEISREAGVIAQGWDGSLGGDVPREPGDRPRWTRLWEATTWVSWTG